MFSGTYIPYAVPKGRSLIQTVSHWLGGGDRPERDFRFDTGVGVMYFSTRADITSQFGVIHGDRVQFAKGHLTGMLATVVGVRGGVLYVVFDGEATCAPLLGCYHKEDLDDKYGLMKVRNAKKVSLVEAPALSIFEESSSSVANLFKTDPQSKGSIPGEVINFLKFAPDLELLVDYEGGEEEEELFSDPSLDDTDPKEKLLKARRAKRQYKVYLCPTYTRNANGVVGWSGDDRVRVQGGGLSPGVVKQYCEAKPNAKHLRHAQLSSDASLDSVVRDLSNYNFSVPCAATATVIIPARLDTKVASNVLSKFHTSDEWEGVVSGEGAAREMSQAELREVGRKSQRDDAVHVLQDSEDAVSQAHSFVMRRASVRASQSQQHNKHESRKSVSFSQQQVDDVFHQRLSQVPGGDELLRELEEDA